MLYDMSFLNPGSCYPPECQEKRLQDYRFYERLFDLCDFSDFNELGCRLYVNFDTIFKLPVLLGFQRLTTIKLADMVIGASPSITVNKDDDMTDKISDLRDQTDFDNKMYQALIDYSRYGVTIFRLFNDDEYMYENKGNFAVWNPKEWFPVIRDDGTRRIVEHVLMWKKNIGTLENPIYRLVVQRHPIQGGKYYQEEYELSGEVLSVGKQLSFEEIDTKGAPCLVQYVANLPSTTNIYGTSDYKIINELVLKATERMRQILYILDKHADPSMTGPATMLTTNENTGELEFKAAKFYAVSPGEEHPEYLTWDGQLDAAFKALEILLNQIYVMSEMGAALMSSNNSTGQAISGTAMRYKMISPLEKARRVCNAFTLPIKKLISGLIKIEYNKDVSYKEINVTWEDSLPKDPREIAELSRLQAGAPQVIPLKHVLMENYNMDTVNAEHYIAEIQKDQETWKSINTNTKESGTAFSRPGEKDNPAAPVNADKKGSEKVPHNLSRSSSTSDVREDKR